MQITAIYPGTFDPVTLGHCDLIRRASQLFDSLVIAIAASPNKTPLFNLQERIELVEVSIGNIDNVSVKGFDSLLVDFAHQQQARVIIRGLRAVSDFEYEFQLAGMNRKLAADIETLFMMPAEQYANISSSLVREVAALGGEVADFVHESVRDALYQKLRPTPA
jgi:pantetheine-phosphate adenylyltransferase